MILTAKNYKQVLTTPGRYRDGAGDVRGLMLTVSSATAASWQLRYQLHGKPHWLGLGSARLLTLTEARERARRARLQLLDGTDPLAAKHQARQTARAIELRSMNFAQAATAYVTQNESKWKHRRGAAQFLSTLQQYVFPLLGTLPVQAIDTALVLKVLEQPHPNGGTFWRTHPATASRVRRRIEHVLDWATVRGYRTGDNPARWGGHLKAALPTASQTTKHLAALPYAEIAGFLATLRPCNDIAARALAFTIHTAARTNEVLGATWAEFDLAAATWTIPAARMKGGRLHRVPLAGPVVTLLGSLPREPNNPHVFISPTRTGAAINSLAMSKLLRRLGHATFTVHGFRSTFMDWAHEHTAYPKVVIDMALAHTVGDKVEAAYRRGELLDKRRRLMEDWARYCAAPISGAVVPIRAQQ